MKHLRHIFCGIILLLGSLYSYAQNSNLEKAQDCEQRHSVDSARTFIDKAMTDAAVRQLADAWYLRGFIYKDMFKKYEPNNLRSAYRDTAVKDLFICYRLDSLNKENKENAFGTLKFLAATYYNNAEMVMDSVNFHWAIYGYNKYKSIMKRMNPAQNFNAFDIRFYDIIGNIYSGYFFSVNDFSVKRKYLDSARKAYDAVLAISPDDYSAVYGIGRLYYNQAVNIINNLPFDASIDNVNKAQDTCIHLAKLSLPYMQKAHLLEPLKIEPIKGLQGDAVMLHEPDNYKLYSDMEKKLKDQQAPKK